ncbi:MAG: hypothetical protein IIA03_05325 [Proteobacteria bacterium]|jgi:hypothetical protein|nr:hypothetical protein [Pseudomonadota bacterium]|mmetsp:Transcript_16307/g.38853  ORF Transcript_16307/g.38853 Transcript_16307/m.38853 type:complete len:158 (-) Transcript_16307:4-477(-)
MRWRKPRPIEVVALAGGVLAAGTVLVMFNRMSGFMGRTTPEPQLIATVDLRLGNTLLARENGAAQARADLEAGLLQLQALEPAEAPTRDAVARERRWKQRYGVVWVAKPGQRTPAAEAFIAGYNGVMRAEIERRHGRRVAEELLPTAPPAPLTENRP